MGLGFEVLGLGLEALGLGFQDLGLGFEDLGLESLQTQGTPNQGGLKPTQSR